MLCGSISLYANSLERNTEACDTANVGSCDRAEFSYPMEKDYSNAIKYYSK